MASEIPLEEGSLRGLHEEAVMAVGVHVAQGGAVWKSWRTWELGLLAGLPSGTPEWDIQVSNTRAVFLRQLLIPFDPAESSANLKVKP